MEVAELLGMTPHAVRNAKYKVNRWLCQALGEEEAEDELAAE